ncbi:hypothetical protein JTB14_005653 [Gonioctena quinquepunctata]|nr:hypothetical protein JTB14_005653 [Gonioctena quinquepunctata]
MDFLSFLVSKNMDAGPGITLNPLIRINWIQEKINFVLGGILRMDTAYGIHRPIDESKYIYDEVSYITDSEEDVEIINDRGIISEENEDLTGIQDDRFNGRIQQNDEPLGIPRINVAFLTNSEISKSILLSVHFRISLNHPKRLLMMRDGDVPLMKE